jgi:hypothetical protein
VAGEDGITETWEYALKHVGNAADEGFYQRYTYADQPRIKLGRTLSAIAAVWNVDAGTLTMALKTSNPTTVSATTTTTGSWVILAAEGLVLDGTYVDLQFSHSAAAHTIYVVPLGVNIGAKALPLPSRDIRFVDASATLVNGVDPAATWTDVDITATSSALTFKALLAGRYSNTSANGKGLAVRRNGSALGSSWDHALCNNDSSGACGGQGEVLTDDAQIFEYIGSEVAANTELCYLFLRGYWEWG